MSAFFYVDVLDCPGAPALISPRYLIYVGYKQDQHDVFLSYLPLAHIFDRVAEEFYLSIGAKIGFWQGNPKLLTDDIAALKPTLFVGVPRIFERVVQGIEAKVRFIHRQPRHLHHTNHFICIDLNIFHVRVVDWWLNEYARCSPRLGL